MSLPDESRDAIGKSQEIWNLIECLRTLYSILWNHSNGVGNLDKIPFEGI
jgi:hypothetical protein